MKNIYPTLLRSMLLLTPALASNASNEAFKQALEEKNLGLIQKLVASHDLDVNQKNEDGNTALMLAIIADHVAFAKELLQRDDVDINTQNKGLHGYTPLMLAIKNKNITLAQQLLKRHDIDINKQNKFGSTVLMLAIRERYMAFAEQLCKRHDINVNLQSDFGNTALMLAIRKNHIKLVKKLVNYKGVDVNLHTLKKETALTYIEHRHINRNEPQGKKHWYVSLVKRTHLPSLDKKHTLLQTAYLHALYAQKPFSQATKQYTDILLINKIANKLQEKQKTLFYQGCLLAYESKNSNYSIQARSIENPNKPSYYQPVLDEDLTHLLAGYLRKVNMKRVSYASDWTHLITCYLWTNNQFALQHNPANMSLKAIHFWSNHNSTYAELLSTANHTQKRALFKVLAQQGQYEAVATQHLARGLQQKNIIPREEQVFEKSITQLTPIIVAGLKVLTC